MFDWDWRGRRKEGRAVVRVRRVRRRTSRLEESGVLAMVMVVVRRLYVGGLQWPAT